MENLKRFGKFIVLILVVLVASCASTSSYRPLSNVPNTEVIGSVQATFFATGGNGYVPVTESIKQQAYIKLKEVASEKYQGNIDVVNITVSLIKWRGTFITAGADYSADGQVVLIGDGGSSARAGTGVEGALARAAEQTLKNVPLRSRIAIVYITAQDRSTTEYIAGELEFIWVNAGYIITDRSELDRIRREQNFQMSGEVDDTTAVSIGQFIGANMVITGRVDGEGNLRRLRLRALNTQTAQVVGVASERL
ncbi:MAG: penicillin-binding protein activator LpoB [Treponema sp.]|jgi:hypothetical protein|nr:penicillin-binding protein activator LpoB [Treponema sp.]